MPPLLPRRPKIPGIPEWTLPPLASEASDAPIVAHQTRHRDAQRPPPRRSLPEVSIAPESVDNIRHGRSKVERYGLAVGFIITALGGPAVLELFKSCNTPKPATAEQQDVTIERLARLEAKFDATGAEEKHWRDKQERRWGIVVDWGCRMNGLKGPEQFARGQDCNSVIWDPPPLGADRPWSAREEWPKP
jgi:hypothetical protein